MTIYAVMKTGGKEHRVAPGDVVRVEKLAAAPGATVEIDEVYLIAIGEDVTVGSPTVANARVVAEVVDEGQGEKIVSFKKKRRNHYQMTMEDVQSYTVLRIREIAVGESVYDAATVTPPPPPAAIELPAPVAARDDASVASQEAQPSSDPVHAAHPAQLPPSAPPSNDTPPARAHSKRSHGIAALVVALLVIAAGLLLRGGGQQQGPVEVATAADAPQAAQAAQASVPQPAAKAPPGKETAIRNPAAGSAPSAPVQPPE